MWVAGRLLRGGAWAESHWYQDRVSATGAVGVMQIEPFTGEWVSRHIAGTHLDIWRAQDNVVAGAMLLALVLYALYDYLRPLIEDRDSGLLIALLILVAIAIVKLAVMPFFPGFGPDVGSYQSWAGQIADQGPAPTY